jgi:hypothetical protein
MTSQTRYTVAMWRPPPSWRPPWSINDSGNSSICRDKLTELKWTEVLRQQEGEIWRCEVSERVLMPTDFLSSSRKQDSFEIHNRVQRSETQDKVTPQDSRPSLAAPELRVGLECSAVAQHPRVRAQPALLGTEGRRQGGDQVSRGRSGDLAPAGGDGWLPSVCPGVMQRCRKWA